MISVPHDIKGETTVAFVILKQESAEFEEVRKSINASIAHDIAKFAVPSKIVFVNGLPKTRSGKLMRRMLRKLAVGDTEFGDTTTLLDSSVLKHISDAMNV